MKKLPKCTNCNKQLSFDNTVLIRIDRFDKYGFSSKQNMLCTACWDNSRIQAPYIKEVHEPEHKNDPYTCGNCTHLILKNYKSETGSCFYTHRIKSFWDRCDHEEEMS